MATWPEIVAIAKVLPHEQINDTMWALTLSVDDMLRKQQVYISYEVMPPNFDFLRITAPIGLAQELDTDWLFHKFGALTAGPLSYVPTSDDNGVVSISANVPLALIDPAEKATFVMYLSTLANAASGVINAVIHEMFEARVPAMHNPPAIRRDFADTR